MNPNRVLTTLVNAAIRGAVYRLIWRAPLAVSVGIVVLALAYALLAGGR